MTVLGAILGGAAGILCGAAGGLHYAVLVYHSTGGSWFAGGLAFIGGWMVFSCAAACIGVAVGWALTELFRGGK